MACGLGVVLGVPIALAESLDLREELEVVGLVRIRWLVAFGQCRSGVLRIFVLIPRRSVVRVFQIESMLMGVDILLLVGFDDTELIGLGCHLGLCSLRRRIAGVCLGGASHNPDDERRNRHSANHEK